MDGHKPFSILSTPTLDHSALDLRFALKAATILRQRGILHLPRSCGRMDGRFGLSVKFIGRPLNYDQKRGLAGLVHQRLLPTILSILYTTSASFLTSHHFFIINEQKTGL